jgi:hypothetical protein
MRARTPVGKTKSQGWEIGVSRTLPVRPGQAWALVLTALGLPQPLARARRRHGHPQTLRQGKRKP